MTDALIAPSARAQFVATLPPDPSWLGQELQRAAGSSFTVLTDTKDAFLHLARRTKERGLSPLATDVHCRHATLLLGHDRDDPEWTAAKAKPTAW